MGQNGKRLQGEIKFSQKGRMPPRRYFLRAKGEAVLGNFVFLKAEGRMDPQRYYFRPVFVGESTGHFSTRPVFRAGLCFPKLPRSSCGEHPTGNVGVQLPSLWQTRSLSSGPPCSCLRRCGACQQRST